MRDAACDGVNEQIRLWRELGCYVYSIGSGGSKYGLIEGMKVGPPRICKDKRYCECICGRKLPLGEGLTITYVLHEPTKECLALLREAVMIKVME